MLAKMASGYLVKLFSIASTFIFVPLYIKYLGLESFSIISLGLIVAGILNVLDSGLTSTLTREFSRNDTNYEWKQDTFKALEMAYLFVLFVIFVTVYGFSAYIASNWINSQHLDKEYLSILLRMIGIEAGCQMMMRFYIGGLIGLERQIAANIIQILWSVFRNGIVVFVIIIDPDISSFYKWQIMSAILFAFIARYLIGSQLNVHLNISLPLKRIMEILNNIWPFVSGVITISIIATLNTQVDKIAIAKFLQIEVLGYYTLAISLSGGLIAIVSPISSVLLPRLTFLFSSRRFDEAVTLYRNFALFISIATFSVSSNLLILSYDIMLAWTGDNDIAENAHDFLAISSGAYSMLAIAVMPYVVAIANGHTKTNAIIGMASLFLTMPGYYFATQNYGGVGAAWVFLIQQTVITIVYTVFITRKFMKINTLNSLVVPIIVPILSTYLIAAIIHNVWPMTFEGRFSHFLKISFSVLATLGIPSAVVVSRIYMLKKYNHKV